MRLNLSGGQPVRVCPAPDISRGATWDSVTDTIVFTTETGLAIVPANGGQPRPLTRRDPGAHSSPVLLPGGRTAIYVVGGDPGSIATVDVASGKTQVLVPNLRPWPSGVQYLPSGHLVYEQNGSLMAIAFNADALQTSGRSVPINQEQAIARLGSTLAQFALSESGSLVHAVRPDGPRDAVLTWVNPNGGEEPSLFPQGDYALPRLSPDGKQIAVVSAASGDDWLQIGDIATGTLRQLARQQGRLTVPAWTPGGVSVTYPSTNVNRQASLIKRTADGAGAEQMLFTVPSEMGSGTWASTPEGEVFAFGRDRDIWIWSANRRNPDPLVATADAEREPAFSPDRRWLAFTSEANGTEEVWVRPYPEEGTPKRISEGGGRNPIWPRDETVFYVHDGRLMSVTVKTRPAFSSGRPRQIIDRGPLALSARGGRNFDWEPITQRFLMVKNVRGPTPPGQIVVVLDWAEELMARLNAAAAKRAP